jgi:hypothetical protein
MAVNINASTSSGLIQTADTSGTLELQSNGTTQLQVDSTGVALKAGGSTQFTVASTGAYGQLKSGTAVTASGSSTIDFTGIPSWAKRITVGFQNISTAATSSISIRLGTSGGVPTTGYQCGFATMAGTDGSTDIAFRVTSASTAAQIANGSATLVNVSGNHWSGNSLVTRYSSSGFVAAAGITLDGPLTTVRVFLEAATTFDAGSINILYEG